MFAPLCLALVPLLQTSSTGSDRAPLASGPRAGTPPPAALSYQSSATGLNTPQWEGGGTELEFADTNGDGNLDILSIGDHGSPFVNTQEHGIMTWFGDGLGNWSVVQNGSFGYGGIAVGDVNGDGHLDVGYGMHHDYSSSDFGDQLLEVALGDGTGLSWTPWDDGLATNGETWGMFATDFADVDGDGLLDVGSNSFGCCAGVHVYRNEGDGSWTQSFGFLGGNASSEFTFGDLDGDGRPDLAAANQNGNVWRGDGAGGFTLVDGNLPGNASGRTGFAFGDVNSDGADEYAFVTSGGQIRVAKWLSGTNWAVVSNGLPASSPYRRTQFADMNRDGHLDLVALGGGQIEVFLGNGGAAWKSGASFSVGVSGSPEALRVADVDHNGRPDIVLLQDETCGLFCSRNKLYFFRESSAPAQLAATVTYPRGGETWRAGSVQTVRWLAAVPGGEASSVDVRLSTNGPAGPWVPLGLDVPNNGTHQFVVPVGVASAEGLVRVIVKTVGGATTAESAAALTLAP